MLKLWRMLYTLPLRLRSLFRREQVEREMAEEFQFYVDARVEQEVARGHSPEEVHHLAPTRHARPLLGGDGPSRIAPRRDRQSEALGRVDPRLHESLNPRGYSPPFQNGKNRP